MPPSVTRASAPESPRRAVMVLGMHRSGTSAVAGCLHRLGVDFGPRLMPATEANAKGYFEHIDLVNLHDRLLLALDSGWDDTRLLPVEWWLDEPRLAPFREELLRLLRRDFGSAALWGTKDPRLCRLLPWWEPVWQALNTRPLYLIVRRSPAEVAASLRQREGFSSDKSHALWLLHTLEAERWTRGRARVFVDFQAFLADWRTALSPVEPLLGQPWRTEPTDQEAFPFVERALSRASLPSSAVLVPTWVAQAEEALQLAGTPDEPAMHHALDRIAEALSAAQFLYGTADDARAADLRHQLQAVRKQARWYDHEWHKARRRTDALR